MIRKVARGGIAGIFLRWASGLRFPYLLILVSGLFLLNLLIPDVIPLVDEILMGLVAVLLASLRKRPQKAAEDSTGERW